MKLVHLFIIITLLAVPMISISTASAQNSTSIYAQNDVTLDVNTGKGHIVITGSVYKLFSYPVVLKIQSPNGTLIAVSQLKPASDGTFSLSISPSAPLWSAQGNYIITVSSDSQEIGKTTFYFNGTNLSSAPHGINTMGRLSPLEQLNTGTAANDVKCNDGLQLIIKAEDGTPACVKPDTAQILVERGWAKSAINDAEISAFRTNTSNSNFTINYSITEGNRILDTNITNDTNTISLAISLDAPSNGSMTLVIPHIMDDMIHNKGAQLVVLSDGKEVINYNETEDKIHSITIPIIKGTKQIIVASIVIM